MKILRCRKFSIKILFSFFGIVYSLLVVFALFNSKAHIEYESTFYEHLEDTAISNICSIDYGSLHEEKVNIFEK